MPLNLSFQFQFEWLRNPSFCENFLLNFISFRLITNSRLFLNILRSKSNFNCLRSLQIAVPTLSSPKINEMPDIRFFVFAGEWKFPKMFSVLFLCAARVLESLGTLTSLICGCVSTSLSSEIIFAQNTKKISSRFKIIFTFGIDGKLCLKMSCNIFVGFHLAIFFFCLRSKKRNLDLHQDDHNYDDTMCCRLLNVLFVGKHLASWYSKRVVKTLRPKSKIVCDHNASLCSIAYF